MFGSYLEQTLTNLIQKEYKPLWFNSVKTIDDDTKFFAMGKTQGNTFYIVNFINGKYPINDYLIEYNDFRNSILSKIKINSIFLNIFICEEDNEAIQNFINNANTTYDLKCLPVFWCINIKEKPKIVFTGDNQPKKILDIQKIITKIKTDINFKSIDVNKLLVTAIITDPVKPRFLFIKLSYILSLVYVLVFSSMIFTYTNLNADTLLSFGGISNTRVFVYNEYFRLVSSIFLTSSLFHLILVIMFLISIGSIFEKYFGHLHFICVFFLTSLIGNIVSSFSPDGVYVGAFLGVIGLISCLTVLSKAFSKSFNHLSYIHLLSIGILLFYYVLYIPYVSIYGAIGSLVSGAIFGILIYLQLKNKNKTLNTSH